jgi:hypothetical protein
LEEISPLRFLRRDGRVQKRGEIPLPRLQASVSIDSTERYTEDIVELQEYFSRKGIELPVRSTKAFRSRGAASQNILRFHRT